MNCHKNEALNICVVVWALLILSSTFSVHVLKVVFTPT